jgi:hypothetical protein
MKKLILILATLIAVAIFAQDPVKEGKESKRDSTRKVEVEVQNPIQKKLEEQTTALDSLIERKLKQVQDTVINK